MEPVLAADAEALRALAKTLAAAAGAIAGIAEPDPVTMPGLVADASSRASDVVAAGYRRVADRIASMSTAAGHNATGYETMDEAFRDQLRRYEAGLD